MGKFLFCLNKMIIFAGLIALAAVPQTVFAAEGDVVWSKADDIPTMTSEIFVRMAVDSTGIYLVGGDFNSYYNSCGATAIQPWFIEKRDLTTGDRIASFGTGGSDGDGIITSTFTGFIYYCMSVTGVAVDSTGIYITGSVFVPYVGTYLYIEKRDLTTGNLINIAGVGSMGSGFEQYDIAVDSSGIYVSSYYYGAGCYGCGRIEKRDLTTGSLISTFGVGGTFGNGIVEESTLVSAYRIAVDSSGLYLARRPYNGWSVGPIPISKLNLTTGSQIFSATGLTTTPGCSIGSCYNGPRRVAVDSTGMYILADHVDNIQPTINGKVVVAKRDLTNGSVISTFGSNGNAIFYPASTYSSSSLSSDMAVDTSGVYIIGGHMNGSYKPAIRKISASDGALIWEKNFTSSYNQRESAIALDSTSIYAVLQRSGVWYVEKYEKTAGPPPPAPVITFTASPSTIIVYGGSSTLTWGATDATSCNAVSPAGWTSSTLTSDSQAVSPTSTTTYIISCGGPGGTTNASTTVTVGPFPPTLTFTASPSSIDTGETSRLTWSSSNTDSCSAVSPAGWTTSTTTSGWQDVSPAVTTTYTISCTGTDGTTQASVTVTIGTCSAVTWSKETYTACQDVAYDVAVDSSGVYAVGAACPGGTANGGNMYVEKRDLDGNIKWTREYSNYSGWDAANGVAVDGTGVYVVGGGDVFGSSGGSGRIEKLDINNGNNVLWWKPTVTAGQASEVALDNTYLYVAGNAGIEKRWLTTGDIVWSQSTTFVAYDIAVDSTGVYITGGGGSTNWRTEKRDLATGGTILWAQDLGFGDGTTPYSIAVGADGVYVGDGRVGYGTDVRKLDLNNGNILWTKSGGFDNQSIAVNNVEGTLYVVGYYYFAGNYELKINKRDVSTGNLIWAKTSPALYAGGNGVALDSAGEIYIAGFGCDSGCTSQSAAPFRTERRGCGGSPSPGAPESNTDPLSWGGFISDTDKMVTIDITTLRTNIDARRTTAEASMVGYSWTSITSSDQIKASHIQEMRDALRDLYNCVNTDLLPGCASNCFCSSGCAGIGSDIPINPSSWTDPDLTGKQIKSIHLTELQTATTAAPMCP